MNDWGHLVLLLAHHLQDRKAERLARGEHLSLGLYAESFPGPRLQPGTRRCPADLLMLATSSLSAFA